MKNNILKQVSAIAMVPIISMAANACSNSSESEKEDWLDNYYKDKAISYSSMFPEDDEFKLNFDNIDENLPMYKDNNPLIFVARRDTWDGMTNWLIGYLSYDDENDTVYFYDIEKKDKLDLASICTYEHDIFFIVADELGLPYDNFMPLSVVKKVLKSANFEFNPKEMVMIDPETGKEIEVPVHDLEFGVFTNMSEFLPTSKQNMTRKLEKNE